MDAQFKMIEARPAITAYVARLEERPALHKADAINKEVLAQHPPPAPPG